MSGSEKIEEVFDVGSDVQKKSACFLACCPSTLGNGGLSEAIFIHQFITPLIVKVFGNNLAASTTNIQIRDA